MVVTLLCYTCCSFTTAHTRGSYSAVLHVLFFHYCTHVVVTLLCYTCCSFTTAHTRGSYSAVLHVLFFHYCTHVVVTLLCYTCCSFTTAHTRGSYSAVLHVLFFHYWTRMLWSYSAVLRRSCLLQWCTHLVVTLLCYTCCSFTTGTHTWLELL